MSEAEKKRRSDYKKKRFERMLLQGIIIGVVTILMLTMALTYYRIDQTYYIDYTEKGNIDYLVELKPNEFYDETLLGSDQAYVASLIETIMADFIYELRMDATNVNFKYSYSIDAVLEIMDRVSKEPLFSPKYELVPPKTLTADSDGPLTVREQISVDYDAYNDLANRFITTYDLSDTESTLVLRMDLHVLSECDEFEQNNENRYVMTLRIPLTTKTVDIEMTSSVAADESKVLACSTTVNRNVFKIIAIVSAVVDVFLIAFLIAFAYLTRNHDINYSIKVKKLLSNYRSYIQRIINEFDTTGYQILSVETFNEMLCIRDTIQSPILMSENADCTSTRFLIPTNTKILYVYEIRVDDYDEIYSTQTDEQDFEDVLINVPQKVEVEEKAIIVEKSADMQAVAEAMSTPDVNLSDIDFVDEIDEEYTPTSENPGVEVIGVVWPERAHKNKIYRYDPNGEKVNDGDMVLVPSRDEAQSKDIVRKAAVAHGNHTVDPDTLKYPLKKIIGVIRRTLSAPLEENSDGK